MDTAENDKDGFVMKITFFSSGSTMAFEDSQQVPAAQKPWVMVFAEYLASIGIDPVGHEFIMPDGRQARIVQIEDEGEVTYNWEI